MTRGLETGHRANVNGASGRYNTRRTERAVTSSEYRCPIAQIGGRGRGVVGWSQTSLTVSGEEKGRGELSGLSQVE